MKKTFFDLKSWGPLKNFKTRSGPYLGLGLSINVKKTEWKSRWTVPLNLVYLTRIWWSDKGLINLTRVWWIWKVWWIWHGSDESNSNLINLLQICSAGSYTQKNFVPRGLIPRGDLFLRGSTPRRILFPGVWYSEYFCSVGSDTPRNFLLRGVRHSWQKGHAESNEKV